MYVGMYVYIATPLYLLPDDDRGVFFYWRGHEIFINVCTHLSLLSFCRALFINV